MRTIVAATLLALFSTSVFAQSTSERIVTPQEFEALSTGKTLYFSSGGRFYGAEQFYTRRRSLWQNSTGECLDGEWYAKGDLICFEYGLETDPACWHFIQNGSSYSARAEGEAPGFDIFLYHTDTRPLDCKGPAIGA